MTNRSAKDGARSSRQYGGEGGLTHPSYQGVCERHGTEELDVTPGGLTLFSGGTGITDPISRETKWERMRCESSDDCIVPEACRKTGYREGGSEVGWGRRSAEGLGRGAKSVSKVGGEEQFLE